MPKIRKWLKKRQYRPTFPIKKITVTAHLQSANVQLEEVSEQHLVPYDENLLERSRTQWQFGDWASLTQLARDTLQHHPDRAKLALLAAAGHLQQGNSTEARQFTRLAQDWGCSKKLVSQILISGVYNSLGRAAAVSGQAQRALQHFESAIAIGAAESERRLLARARNWSQLEQIGLNINRTNTLKHQASQLDHSRQTLLYEGYEACAYRIGDQVNKDHG